jgi:hypothetical protein
LLCDIVENCLTVNEDYRLSCEDLLADIPPFEVICEHYAGDNQGDALGDTLQIKVRGPVGQVGKAKVTESQPELLDRRSHVRDSGPKIFQNPTKLGY